MALARASTSAAAGMLQPGTGAVAAAATSRPAWRSLSVAASSGMAGPSTAPQRSTTLIKSDVLRCRAFSTTPFALGKSPPGKGKNAQRKARREARLERLKAGKEEEHTPNADIKEEQQRLPFAEAVQLFHAVEVARPLNAFELHVVTNVSSHQANALRGRLALPKEARTRSEKILIFAEDDSESHNAVKRLQAASPALQSGIVVGGAELIQDVVQGRGQAAGIDFTKVLSTDSLLPQVSRALARSLGPRGLMPSAKRGTVARTGLEMETAIREAQGAIDWRGDRNGVVRGGE